MVLQKFDEDKYSFKNIIYIWENGQYFWKFQRGR